MSDVQQYLLKTDSDKTGAGQVAKRTAESTMPFEQIWCPELTDR